MMGVRDVIVHLDDSERCAARLEIALDLARFQLARVTGVFAQSNPDAARQRVQDRFNQAIADAGVEARWEAVASGDHAHIIRALTSAASCTDLVIMGQHDPDTGRLLPHDLTEQVILHSGRPVLVIPYAGKFEEVGRRPLIAWNGSREAVRALHDALPLMGSATQALLVMVDNSRQHIDEQPILHFLDNHGLIGKVERLMAEDIGIMDVLLSRVTDTGCDMLVMGAHGHYVFPLTRGSGTRHILRHMTVPVLMSA